MTIVPAVLSANDVAPKTLHKSLMNLLNLKKSSSNNIQKAAVLGTRHTVRKFRSLRL